MIGRLINNNNNNTFYLEAPIKALTVTLHDTDKTTVEHYNRNSQSKW